MFVENYKLHSHTADVIMEKFQKLISVPFYFTIMPSLEEAESDILESKEKLKTYEPGAVSIENPISPTPASGAFFFSSFKGIHDAYFEDESFLFVSDKKLIITKDYSTMIFIIFECA
jgi:hypothetical protein